MPGPMRNPRSEAAGRAVAEASVEVKSMPARMPVVSMAPLGAMDIRLEHASPVNGCSRTNLAAARHRLVWTAHVLRVRREPKNAGQIRRAAAITAGIGNTMSRVRARHRYASMVHACNAHRRPCVVTAVRPKHATTTAFGKTRRPVHSDAAMACARAFAYPHRNNVTAACRKYAMKPDRGNRVRRVRARRRFVLVEPACNAHPMKCVAMARSCRHATRMECGKQPKRVHLHVKMRCARAFVYPGNNNASETHLKRAPMPVRGKTNRFVRSYAPTANAAVCASQDRKRVLARRPQHAI